MTTQAQDQEFETKLASAGALFEKVAKEHGLSVNDFTEQEAIDIVTTLMGDEKVASVLSPGGTAGAGTSVASTAPSTTPSSGAAAPPKVAGAEEPKFTYGEVMSEVVKFAAANNVDLGKIPPAELDAWVVKMAAHMAQAQTPEFQQKQAALQEKYAEADAMGRVMAHAYVDELGKIAEKTASEESQEEKEKREEKEKAEKKAAFVNALRGKLAGEMPEAFKKHMKGKEHGEPDADDKKDKEEEKEKEAFAKQASLRAAELLILDGIDPMTGAKFASEQERLDAGAHLLLALKGYR